MNAGYWFHDNVTIITGASYGIGRALAIELSKQGAILALAARDEKALNEVADECNTNGGEALVVPTDISNQQQCKNLVECTCAHYGRIDSLVNNAGICMISPFDDVNEITLYERIMQVNYFGSVYCTHYCLPHLKSSQGRIVAMCSIAGITGVPAYSAYSASKHAMIGFFESIRVELKSSGVSITIVMPDFVSSGIHERSFDSEGRLMGMRHNIDYQRAMTPEVCARLSLRAMYKRKREVILSSRGKVGRWAKLVAPEAIDSLTSKAVRRGY